MPQPELTPIQRLVLAFWALFAVIFRADVAAAVDRVRQAGRHGLPIPAPPEPARVPASAPSDPAPAARAVTAPPAATPAPPPPPTPTPPAPFAAKPPVAKPAEPVVSAPPAPAPSPVAVAPAPVPVAPVKAPEPPRTPDPRGALQLLALLQREGRLVDFVEEDLTGFPDASIGAAARTVHAGCKRAIEELFRLEPVYREPEGAKVTVAPGFDASAVRLTGNVVGQPPFQGALRHHGWRAREVKLPPAPDGKDLAILAPAEVEL